MKNHIVNIMQTEGVDKGRLQVNVLAPGTEPIQGATVSISYTGEPGSTIEQVGTDISGQTELVELDTPPLEYSQEPGDQQPYAEYTIDIDAPGYNHQVVSGIELLPEETAIQNIELTPVGDTESQEDPVVIPPHTLYGSYPPKIAESEIKPVNESGEIVLSRVVVPEYVIVHDGSPRDSSAPNYYVKYKDYIKNVASSEIYATWPDATIRANVLAIMSFTLNRVYTEWYRNRGYEFTISSSTAFDHKYIHNRNIYQNLSQIVDEMFSNYLARPNVKQPILTQYCDGRQVSCPNWMTQWGSKELGDQGYSAIQIIRYFYGDEMYIGTAEEISGVPSSWPGQNLTIGSSGAKVRQMQEEINGISRKFPAIPTIAVDGQFGEGTRNAVQKIQEVFDLPVTGIVDFATWYKISEIYVATSRIAELN